MTITNAQIAAQISDLVDRVSTRDEEFATWLTGPADGGDFGDGTYPLTDYLGETRYVSSPDALAAGVQGSAQSAQDAADQADTTLVQIEGLKDDIELIQSLIVGYRSDIEGWKGTTISARNEALNAANLAGNSSANAAQSEANAAQSEANAAQSEANAAQSETNAAASATAAATSASQAATFNPALYVLNTELDSRIDALVGAAPGALDTLQELASALGDDPNFATTVTTELAGKAPLSHRHSWDDLDDVPTEFTPESHGHSWGEISGKPDQATRWPAWNEVTGKPNVSLDGHGHAIADVSGLQTALDGKSNVGHGHSWGEISGKPSYATRWPTWTELSSFPQGGYLKLNMQWSSESGWHSASTQNGAYAIRNSSSATDGGLEFKVYNGAVTAGQSLSPTSYYMKNDNFYIGTHGMWHDGNFDPDGKSDVGHTHDYLPKGSLGRIGGIDVTPGDATDWPDNPDPGFYSRDYSGSNGLVFMTGDVGGSTSSIGLEFQYNGSFWMHSNTDSSGWQSYQIFTDSYHPNADKWTNARTLTLTGDVTGSVSIDGSSNVSLSATVANNSHTHTIANVTGLQDALDGKSAVGHTHSYLPLSGGTLTNWLTIQRPSYNPLVLERTDSDANVHITFNGSSGLLGYLGFGGGELKVHYTDANLSANGHHIYHEGYKPSISEVLSGSTGYDYTFTGDLTFSNEVLFDGNGEGIRFQPSGSNDSGGIRFTSSGNDGVMEFWTSDDWSEPFVWASYDVKNDFTSTRREWMKLEDSGLTLGGGIDASGLIVTTNSVQAGRGSGSVAIAVNDGGGNANLTFNHLGNTPEQDGNVGRIAVNVDESTDAYMRFTLGSGLTAGQSGGTTHAMQLYEESLELGGKEAFRFYDNWLRVNVNGDFPNGVYLGTSKFRTDGEIQVGANGSSFLVTSSSFKYNGNNVYHGGNQLSLGTSASSGRSALGLGTAATKNITVSTSSPSGGSNGDIWIKV